MQQVSKKYKDLDMNVIHNRGSLWWTINILVRIKFITENVNRA